VEDFFNEDYLFPIIDSLEILLDTWIQEDPQYKGIIQSTYGYNYEDWKKGIQLSLGDHGSFGVKEYISKRVSSIQKQLKFSHQSKVNGTENKQVIYPNPVENVLFFTNDFLNKRFEIFTTQGLKIFKVLQIIMG